MKEEGIFNKIKKYIDRILGKSVKRLEEGREKIKKPEEQLEVKKAKKAYNSYMLEKEYEKIEKILKTIKQRIEANKDMIEKMIELEKKEITYDEIKEELEKETNELYKYKYTKKTEKIDENYMFASYYVPIGIIVIRSNNVKEKIRSIFKGITTRNAIIIEKEEKEYSIEKLIEVIVKECLKKYKVDDNIIQISKEEIKKYDRKIIDGKVEKKEKTAKLYIYEENIEFKEEVEKEEKRLKKQGKEVEVIRGEIEEVIEKINEKESKGCNIYTKEKEKGYMYINMINSENIFINGTLENMRETEESKDPYYMEKNIICEYYRIVK